MRHSANYSNNSELFKSIIIFSAVTIWFMQLRLCQTDFDLYVFALVAALCIMQDAKLVFLGI